MVIPQVWWAAANFAFYLLFQVVTLFIPNYNYYSIDNALTQSVAHSVSIFVTLQVVILLGCWIFQNLEFADISFRSSILGLLFIIGIQVTIFAPDSYTVFGPYMMVMSFFHFSEFICIGIVQPTQVSTDSFVLNHSPQYIIAAVISWVEFFVEAYYFPGLKKHFYVSCLGLLICLAGEFLRKAAILTAGRNFHHLVQSHKAKGHTLVTTGVYSLFRHPSYVGWFYWAIGTQILLVNPLCIPAYAVVSWMFFKSRIFIEEITLLNFFGQDYINYQKKVGTGLPFIQGYEL